MKSKSASERPPKSKPSAGRTAAIESKSLAGAPGFEPGNGGIKIRCLTAWLRPIGYSRSGADDTDEGPPDQRPLRLRARGARGYIGASAKYRSVAQPGSAPRSGRGGRRFKSCHSDQHFPDHPRVFARSYGALSPTSRLAGDQVHRGAGATSVMTGT